MRAIHILKILLFHQQITDHVAAHAAHRLAFLVRLKGALLSQVRTHAAAAHHLTIQSSVLSPL
jgi:hypothetical protein